MIICLSGHGPRETEQRKGEKKSNTSKQSPTPCGAPKIKFRLKNPHNHLLPVTHLKNLYKSTTTQRERRERSGHLPIAKKFFAQRLQGEIFRA
jgi:hypothetical protein